MFQMFQSYTIQNINNGVLNASKAMPMKDINTNGTAESENSRAEYSRTVGEINKMQKKCYNNRDASDVIRRRRVGEVGVGSFNAEKVASSNLSKTDQHVRNSALAHVRNAGSAVPKKVTGSNKIFG